MFQTTATLTSFIIDAEIVAIDRDSGALKSFQELSGRARKNVNLKDVKISVGIFAFDLMYLNGEVGCMFSALLQAFTRHVVVTLGT